MSFADAVTREAAWLNGEPAVVSGVGQVAAYGRLLTASNTKTARLYRESYRELRETTGLVFVTHRFLLRLTWPLGTASQQPHEAEQALDNALDTVLARVRGPAADKTHGGRFMSAAEDMDGGRDGAITVTWATPDSSPEPPDRAVVEIRYSADEQISA